MKLAIGKLREVEEAGPAVLHAPFGNERMIAERALEIISEASRRLPEDWKAARPGIPWRRIADIGNHLRHAYQRVDAEILAGIIETGLADLEAAVDAVLADY